MQDALEVREALTGKLLPVSKGCHLGLGDRRSRYRLTVIGALAEPLDEGRTCLLARFRRRTKDLLQDCVSVEVGIAEIPSEAGLMEVHDVLSPSGCGANKDHAPENRGAVLRHLLRDHAAK